MDFPIVVLCYSASRIVMVGARREWDSTPAGFTSRPFIINDAYMKVPRIYQAVALALCSSERPHFY